MTDPINRADAIAYIDRVINSGLGRNKSLDYIHKYISALPSAEAEWIPCSERLPEKDGWYLVTVQGYETVTDVSLYSADDGCAWGDVSAKQKVIAWMPLPKPYREDGEV